MKIDENAIKEKNENGLIEEEEKISSLSDEQLYKNDFNKDKLTNDTNEYNFESEDLSNKIITDEIQSRAKEIVIKFDKVCKKLSSSNNSEYKSVYENYEYFKEKSHEILTGENNTALRGQKTRIAEGKVKAYYLASSEKYEENEYVYFVNQKKFGRHIKPVNTRKKLRDLNPMEFLSFMGIYKDEIVETLSGYFKKQDKARRMCELIREYGYHKNPPRPKIKTTMEIKDRDSLMSVIPRSGTGYTETDRNKEFYKGKLEKIDFITTDGKPWGWGNTKTRSKLVLHYEDEQEDGEDYIDNKTELYEISLTDRLNEPELLHIIDLEKEIKQLIDEGLDRREKELEKFDRFIKDFKKEFKKELMSMRL